MTDSNPQEPQASLTPREREDSQERVEHQRLEFYKRVDDAVHEAERSGATTSVLVVTLQDFRDGNPSLYEHIAEERPGETLLMHPASTIKMAQALYLTSKLRHLSEKELNDEHAVHWRDFVVGDERQNKKGDFIEGGGEYDKSKYRDNPALRHASYRQLFEDMLGPGSGNMAQKILMGRYSAKDFNAFWQEKAPTVQMVPAGDRGWFTLANVSPRDMLKVVVSATELKDSPVDRLVHDALTGGSGKIGTVSGALDEHMREKLLTKTGELPPDEDDPYYTRHDIGLFEDYAYVIMTHAPNKKALGASEELIEKIGAYIAHEKGYSTTERARRSLGKGTLGVVNKLMGRFRS